MFTNERQRYAAGIIFLLGVVFIWVGSSFLMNNIFAGQDYNKPFTITYINTASFSLYLLAFFLSKQKLFMRTHRITLYHYTGAHSHIDPHDLLLSTHNEQKLSNREVAKLGLTFCILWFAANWSSNASLAYTNVASSTILASMSGFFTLGIGALVGIEKLSFLKFIAVVVSIIGVFMISKEDTLEKPGENPALNPLLGNFLALLGAFFYGCYTVLLKLRIQNESHVNMPLFFGFVGIFNIFLLWPFFWLLDWLNIECFQLPPSNTLWIMIATNALVGTFLSDYLWLLAVLMTSPLVVTLGMSLTIPMSLIGDSVFKGILMSNTYWFGAFIILSGFLAVNFAALKENENENEQKYTLLNDDVVL
ncbi:thiamine-repressible mitochondrial transport protein THI74 [Gigaspora rosea]|uniref:Thiamine-repressible mitochondrial transport protein THI74 n=1 Tax=Gigaspora rosea TaxID=44941 RepID=A0A397W4C7_9GLOM|nr:thiamine-repressible mitochondrial transport protein THI74 [Gigaspora rosea]